MLRARAFACVRACARGLDNDTPLRKVAPGPLPNHARGARECDWVSGWLNACLRRAVGVWLGGRAGARSLGGGGLLLRERRPGKFRGALARRRVYHGPPRLSLSLCLSLSLSLSLSLALVALARSLARSRRSLSLSLLSHSCKFISGIFWNVYII